MANTEPESEPGPEPLAGREFHNRSLRGSRWVECDLREVVVRGSELAGLELDSAWLMEGGTLVVNGVDVVPLVDAELNRRFPGRKLRTATDPAGLREAWAALERTWATTMSRATVLGDDSFERRVDGEWSLAQTLRHLVMATDVWLGKAILQQDNPYHPLGLPNDDGDTEAYDPDAFSTADPSREEVLAARADRQSLVRAFLADVTADQLRAPRKNPHSPTHDETVLSCLSTILEEEWEHHRYAVRDLDAIAARPRPT
ncbi:MAG: DinB family protein [Tetrasphaera sp.]